VTYTELVNAIQSYTENVFPDTYLADGSVYDSTQQLNTFITQAETRIYNTVLIPALRKNVTAIINSGFKYLSCPDDFLSSFSLAVIDGDGNYEYLLDKDVNFIRAAYPNPNDQAIPQYYSLFGPTIVDGASTAELSFILGPTPDANYDVELHYYYYPESITTATSGTTWLGDNYSPVLLYGSLVEAYIFMKGEQDMLATYEKKYQDSLMQLIRLGGALERGDAYRDGQYKGKAAP
jgi:hypothetical protein